MRTTCPFLHTHLSLFPLIDHTFSLSQDTSHNSFFYVYALYRASGYFLLLDTPYHLSATSLPPNLFPSPDSPPPSFRFQTSTLLPVTGRPPARLSATRPLAVSMYFMYHLPVTYSLYHLYIFITPLQVTIEWVYICYTSARGVASGRDGEEGNERAPVHYLLLSLSRIAVFWSSSIIINDNKAVLLLSKAARRGPV